MWAFGRLDLGLSDAEFWDSTIEEFTALANRHKERERMLNYRAGVIASMIYNVNRGKTQEALKPLELFESPAESIGMTNSQIMTECEAAYARACVARRQHG